MLSPFWRHKVQISASAPAILTLEFYDFLDSLYANLDNCLLVVQDQVDWRLITSYTNSVLLITEVFSCNTRLTEKTKLSIWMEGQNRCNKELAENYERFGT